MSEGGSVPSRAEVEAFLGRSFDGYQAVPLPYGLKVPGADHSARMDRVFSLDLRGRSVLDVGTGYGAFLHEAVRRGARRAVGIEPDPDRCAVAREIGRLHGNRWEVRQADLTDLAGEQFDVVLLLNVLHHVTDPVAAMRHLVGLCRETMVVEFCLPEDPQHLVHLIDPRPHPARTARWRAVARSLVLRRMTGGLPMMAVGNRPYDRTFYFSPQAFDHLFRVHLRFFDRIEFGPSVSRFRRLARCRVAPGQHDGAAKPASAA
jgi:SAM-dependent methyltransferase